MSSPGVTLSGKIRDVFGNPIAGTVTATLGNYGANAPIIAGDSEIAPIAATATANGSGIWSLNLWGSDQISPTSTTYTISITPANSNVAIWISEYLIKSGSYDLSNLIPIIVTPTTYVQPMAGPPGPQGPPGVGSTWTIVTSSINFSANPGAACFVTTGASTIIATLPDPTVIPGQSIFVKKVDSGSGVIVLAGTIDQNINYTIVNQNQYVEVASDGSIWQIISNN